MIVKNLRKSRENLELMQKEIAIFHNVNYSTVSGWETGKDTIPLKRLIKYANHYNLSFDYLFGLTKYNDSNYLPLNINLDIIANNLKVLRKCNNMTQQEVAKKMNTNQSTYAHYELANNLITTTFLYSLTKIYKKKFSIDGLLGRKKREI